MAASSSLSRLRGGALPAELVDQIIDYNHSDRAALAATALVARQWTPGSRFHLFAAVEVSHENARQLVQLLLSPRCTFIRAMRRVNILFVAGSQKWFGEFSKRLQQLNRVNIAALGIMGSRPTVLREEARTAIVSFYPQLRQLIVGPLVMEKPFDFVALVAGLKGLQSLSCAASFQSASFTNQPLNLQLPRQLQSIELTTPSIKSILDFLNRAPPPITELKLVFMMKDDYAPVKAFLERPNATLRALKITMDSHLSGVSLNTFAERVNLTQLTALRALDIQTAPCMPPLMVFGILNSVASSNLRELKLTACIGGGLAQVDGLLTRPGSKFQHLRTVTVVGQDPADVRLQMPRCASLNILRQS